jgi:hypothetical protein
MANSYSPASLDLGLGDGNALTDQVDQTEEERRKRLKMGGQADAMSAGANTMGLAAMNLLGSFRAG